MRTVVKTVGLTYLSHQMGTGIMSSITRVYGRATGFENKMLCHQCFYKSDSVHFKGGDRGF